MCGLLGSAGAFGFLISSALGAALTAVLSSADVEQFGWRIPFMLGSLIALTAFYLRGELPDGDDRAGYERLADRGSRVTDVTLFAARTLLGCACYMAGFYLIFVYLPNGLHSHGGATLNGALTITSGALLLLALVAPVAGIIADRIGSARLLLAACALLVVLGIPLFAWLDHPSAPSTVWFSIAALTLLFAPIHAAMPLPFIDRALQTGDGMGFSLGFNVASVAFGGLTPIIANSVTVATGSLSACGWLLAATAALSAVTLKSVWRHLPLYGVEHRHG